MKSFLLAGTVAVGLLCSANSADAQFFPRRSNVYVAPSYNSYPTYTLPTYSYPYYYGGVRTYYPPAYTPGAYSSYYSPYVGGSYYSGYGAYSGLYGSGYYGGYRFGRWGW